MTTTTGQSIAATVGLVDYGFNNPNGSNTAQYANTWGVVGGNTAQYGKQVSVTVAIGANGTGTLFTSTTSTKAVGLNTNFATNVANGAIIQIPVANVNGIQTDYTTVGYVTGTPGNNAVVIANTTRNSFYVGQGNIVSFLNVTGATAAPFSITELGMPYAPTGTSGVNIDPANGGISN